MLIFLIPYGKYGQCAWAQCGADRVTVMHIFIRSTQFLVLMLTKY